MAEFTYEITERIAVLSTNARGWERQLNMISWNGKDPKYDIRDWSPDGSKMGKGISMTRDELAALAAETGDDDVRRRISAVSLKLRKQTAHNLSEGFKKYFGEVSPAFDSKLKEAHPNLTLNDHRLCAYIYMGLTSKEISQITFKEVESVEKSRNRLRKKIGIDSSVSIRDYLSSIIDGGDVSCAEMNS